MSKKKRFCKIKQWDIKIPKEAWDNICRLLSLSIYEWNLTFHMLSDSYYEQKDINNPPIFPINYQMQTETVKQESI